jgi:hypothetical protein
MGIYQMVGRRIWGDLMSKLMEDFKLFADVFRNKMLATADIIGFSDRIKSVYEVKSGDNLWAIARKHGVGVSHVLNINPELVGKEDKLSIGQKIKIPYSPMDLARQLKGKPIDEILSEVSRSYKIDADAFRYALMQESKMDPRAFNEKTKASGLGQLMPEVAQNFGVTDVWDPAQNAAAAAAHLQAYISEVKHLVPNVDADTALWYAFMAYNWGIGNFKKWIASGKSFAPPKETRWYPAGIFLNMKKNPPSEFVNDYRDYVASKYVAAL